MPAPLIRIREPVIREYFGWIKCPRGLLDDPIFEHSQFTEREAYLWLCCHAVFSPGAYDINGEVVHLKRGQASYSSRFLAKNWAWDKGKVLRFLRKMEKAGKIELEKLRKSGNKSSEFIITICNYDGNYDDYSFDEAQDKAKGKSQARRAYSVLEANNKKEKNDKIKKTPTEKIPLIEPVESWKKAILSVIGQGAYVSWIQNCEIIDGVFYAQSNFCLNKCKEMFGAQIEKAYGKPIEWAICGA